MATTHGTVSLEKRHFSNFRKYFPGIDTMCDQTIDRLIDMGTIQVSTAFELAIANVADLDVISVNSYDLSDGSDGKLSTCRYTTYGTCYSSSVTNTRTKTGTLRVQVLEPIKDTFYYFVIPYDAHSKIKGSSNIEIPFTIEGEPKRNYTPRFLPNWWRFEVESFEEMCLRKG